MFRAALLIIAKNWKQPGCPSITEWINIVQPNSGVFSVTEKKKKKRASELLKDMEEPQKYIAK